jgi:outer membrane immunogenic protein
MKKILLGTTMVAGLLAAGAAQAADLPTKAPYYKAPQAYFSWAGWYLGASVGGAFGHDRILDVGELAGTRYSNNPSGVFGGGQIGFNFQSGQFVWGIEADLGGMGLSKTTGEPGAPTILFTTIKSGFYGDVTGRLGIAAWDRTLLYVKGGYAFYDGKITQTDVGEATFGKSSHSGWTIGGGVEQMFSPGWSWKLEYLHFDFGRFNNVNPVDLPDVYRNTFTVDTVKAGINYHFGAQY